MNFEELEKLHLYLDKKEIQHEFKPLYDGKQILIKRTNKTLSFITHFGSYGNKEGLIEYYNFKNVPKGWLSASECKSIIRKELSNEMNKNNENNIIIFQNKQEYEKYLKKREFYAFSKDKNFSN